MKYKRRQTSDTMRLGALLALVGGFLDAYTYIARGGVFANAQTGNTVLLGLTLASGQFARAMRYLLPILAFVCGVVIADSIRWRYRKPDMKKAAMHWRQIVVLTEIILLVVVSFVPQSANAVVNIVISLVCALQVETFRKVHGNTLTTTMCTGNLRAGTEQLVLWRQTGDRAAGKRALTYFAIILFFVLGAVMGAVLTTLLAEKAAIVCSIMLVAVFAAMFREEL